LQDKVAILDGQVQQLKADKARLLEENKALHQRKTILEKGYAFKEEQIQMLQATAAVADPPAVVCSHACDLSASVVSCSLPHLLQFAL
jgi:hypothetical protein